MHNLEMDAGSIESFSEGNGDKRRRLKMKERGKATIKDEVRSMSQTAMYARFTEDLLETDVTVQPVADNLKMDVGLIENLSQGSANKEKKESLGRNGEKKVTIKDEIQNMGPIARDTRVIENVHETDLTVQPLADNLKIGLDSIENLSEGNANMKKKKRRKRNKKKKVAIKVDAHIMDQTPMYTRSINRLDTDSAIPPQADNPKMDSGSTENLSGGNVTKGKKKRPKRNKKKKATIMDEVQSMDQITMDIRSQEDLLETDLITMDAMSKENHLETDLIMQSQADNMKTDAGSMENLSEGNVNKKKKKRLRRKNKKKATTITEAHSMDRTTMETMSKENLLETDLTVQPLPDNLKTEAGLAENPADGDEIQTMGRTTMFTGSTENLAERNVISKRRRRKKSNKVQIIGSLQSADQAKTGTGLIENLAEGNVTSRRKRKRKSKKAKNKCTNDMNSSSVSLSNLTDKTFDFYKHQETVLLPNMVEGSCYKASFGLSQDRFGPLARPMELEGKLFPCESQHIAHPSLMTEVDNEIILYQGKGSAEGRSSFSAFNLEVSTHFSSDMKHADCLYTKMTPSISIRRKLLVLDVNGLLADIVQPPPKHCRGDMHIFGRAIFTRPFCDEFMKFCFQNFDVGIWSSRSRKILDKVVNYLLGDLKHKLLFCWDRVLCTQTGFKTLENNHKPLVCKELRKIWDNNDPNLPWKKGDYNESNTLLLDDSPYKALLNPLHTAIFPHSYTYLDKNDNSLGPGGNLRVYLEGLASSENVQKYVEQHPFGQSNIDEKSLSWGFYAGVLNSLEEKKTHHSAL